MPGQSAARRVPVTSKPNGRRSTAEVRRLLLDSARTLFASKGYASTTTREIAERAGVSETLLFRHFDSKQRLFDQAITRPFQEFTARYLAEWEAQPILAQPPERLIRNFVEGFYDLLTEHRELVRALVAAGVLEGGRDPVERVQSPFNHLLKQFEGVAAGEQDAWRYSFNPRVAVPVVVGMVMAVALMEDWLVPQRRGRPGRARLIDEIVGILVHGLTHPWDEPLGGGTLP
jgi:AcrR family transcriptional regulator